jgi:hypothetical protein
MARKRLGRPRMNPGEKRMSTSIAVGSHLLKWLDETAKAHGVSRSQIVDDAMKIYRGEMEDTLRHLREELTSQEENVKTLMALTQQKEEELERLRASQQMVGTILSPYGGPQDALTKEAKEKSRTLRAIARNDNLVWEVAALVEGRAKTPSLPILSAAHQAWGSWANIMDAIKAAQAASGGAAQ